MGKKLQGNKIFDVKRVENSFKTRINIEALILKRSLKWSAPCVEIAGFEILKKYFL